MASLVMRRCCRLAGSFGKRGGKQHNIQTCADTGGRSRTEIVLFFVRFVRFVPSQLTWLGQEPRNSGTAIERISRIARTNSGASAIGVPESVFVRAVFVWVRDPQGSYTAVRTIVCNSEIQYRLLFIDANANDIDRALSGPHVARSGKQNRATSTIGHLESA